MPRKAPAPKAPLPVDPLTLEEVGIASLKPHPQNYRDHTPDQLDHLRQSLETFGVYKNIVVARDNTILAGHGLVEAAQQLGMTTLPVHRRDLDPQEEEAIRLLVGDNETARLAIMQEQRLAGLLQGLAGSPGGLLGTGYDAEAVAALVQQQLQGVAEGGQVEEVEPQLDRAEVLRELWGVEPGQLWQLGRHRVLCGDCTESEQVERLLEGQQAQMVFTDPPYNVGSESSLYAAKAPTGRKNIGVLQHASWDQAFQVAPALAALEQTLAADCTVYVCSSHWLIADIWDWMSHWSEVYGYIVWCKPNPFPALSKRHWTWAAELIAYATRGQHVCNFPLQGHALNWWEIVSPSHTTPHPTEKPVEVPARAIAFSSVPGALVYDGFLGSGTTLMACEQLGRTCYGMEIAPGYVAVTLQRFQDATGQQPQRVE